MKKALADALSARGYTTLTPVQVAVTDPDLTGKDLLVSAQTGSGKTLGFGLAIAPTLLGDAEGFAPAALPLALVIAPTRELAMQVKRELAWLYAPAGATVASCVGGMDMRDERRILARGAHVVVATPGRLRDHIMRGSIDLGAIRAIVLDEADEMLDLGFREELEFILGSAPEDRQTLMFSATVPGAIARLAKSYQRDAVRIETKSEASQHADIEYRAMNVAARDDENAIINVLRFYEAPNAIVFCNTRAMVNRITTRLHNRGFSVVALSGELTQNERTHALQAMRDGRARVCVATDVAARGIDLPNLDLVVHAELPNNHETLLHRSGRTGRAGRKGVSTLIVPPKSRRKAERILGAANLKATWGDAPSADEIRARDSDRMLGDPAWAEEITESEQPNVDKLVATFTPDQIAAAYLRLYASNHSAPEDLSAADDKPAPRAAFGPSVWFSVAGGRQAGAEPRRLLPMLCKAGNITRDDIGAIRVQFNETFVEILAGRVPAFLAAIGPAMVVEGGASLTQLAKAPDLAAARSHTARPGGPAPKPAQKSPRKPARDAGPDAGPDASPVAAPDVTLKAAPKADPAPAPANHGTTKPVDWNDAPAPRPKKPKPAKPAKPGKAPAPRKAYKSAAAATDAPVSETFPRRKPLGAKPTGAKPKPAHRKGDGPKGPPPPTGKKNSKKNKLRAQLAKASGKPTRGAAPPKRPKPS